MSASLPVAGRILALGLAMVSLGLLLPAASSAAPPENTVRPAMYGNARVGDGMLCGPGVWRAATGGFAYSWERDFKAIPGASGQAYQLRPEDARHVIGCRVTATNGEGSTAALTRTAAVRKRNDPCAFFVDGKQTCLRKGRACKPAHRDDYLNAGLACKRRKGKRGRRKAKRVLVKASEAALRRGELVRLGPNGRPSFSTALQAFDKLVVDLPGVKQRRGVVGTGPGGTQALKWLVHYRNRLTRAQRRVLDRVRARRGQRVQKAGGASATALYMLVQEGIGRLKARGLPLNHPVDVVFEQEEGAPDDYAFTDPVWLDAAGPECVIHFLPLAKRSGVNEQRALAIHELMHCVEAEFLSTRQQYANVQPWVDEGGASWVAATVVTEAGYALPQTYLKLWKQWFDTSQPDVASRTYSAIGFWALLKQQGVDPFTRFGPTVQAAASGNPIGAYLVATNGAPNLMPNWGPSLALAPEAGPLWDTFAPGAPSVTYHRKAIGNGGTFGETVQARGGYAVELDIQADVVVLTPSDNVAGFFRAAGGSDRPLAGGGPEPFCAKPGGCTCEGEDLGYEQIGRGKALLGYAGYTGGGATQVEGQSLEEHCKKLIETLGIQVFQNVGDTAQIVGVFKSVTCRENRPPASPRFRATGTTTNRLYELDAQIGPAWQGFGSEYTLEFGGSDPSFTLSGPGGPYSNGVAPPDNPGWGGEMVVGPGGRLFGIGFVNAFNPDLSNAALIAGIAPCKRARR